MQFGRREKFFPKKNYFSLRTTATVFHILESLWIRMKPDRVHWASVGAFRGEGRRGRNGGSETPFEINNLINALSRPPLDSPQHAATI